MLQSGGLFAATLFDGDAVTRLLERNRGAVERRVDDALVWRIEDVGGAGPYGKKINVYVDSINTYQEEYVVP